jgi:chorismate mutase/prephenate dehydratase
MPGIENHRKEIDLIDAEILRLLSQRGKVALKIAGIKKRDNLSFHYPDRERQIFKRLHMLNEGPLPKSAISAIFREIFSATLALEEPLRVAYLGPEGTFAHLAALKLFGSSTISLARASIGEVFEAVAKDKAYYGVVPIENSIEGAVNYTLDMFVNYDLYINAEMMLPISHNLLSQTGKMENIQKVYSHPQPVAQCRHFIETYLRGIPIIETLSTAQAAEYASKDSSSAAIASEIAAKLYSLRFIEQDIEDTSDNYTRFLVISHHYRRKSGNDKTSIVFSIEDRVGALYSVLLYFKKYNLNLTKIESRPSKKKAWDYVFFVDIIGHIQDEPLGAALNEINNQCLFLKVLGSYPMADTP